MSTALESKVRIQREDFSVTDEIEFMKKSSPQYWRHHHFPRHWQGIEQR